MAIKPRQVIEDYRTKRQLEKALRGEWDSLRKAIVRRYTGVIGRDGHVIDPQVEFGPRLQRILAHHYQTTGDAFRGRLGVRLPADVAPTAAELGRIEEALTEAFGIRAGDQAALIGKTTAQHMDEALAAARAETLRVAGGGVARDRLAEAIDAGRMLDRRLMGRASGIASLETQAPAEISKLTEVEVLTNHVPTVDGGVYSEPDLIKRWWSMGDDLAREDHLQADQQEQQIGQPYTVGGASLMTPGDTSLGAPLRQVINCRCASEFDEDAVAGIRRERGLGNA